MLSLSLFFPLLCFFFSFLSCVSLSLCHSFPFNIFISPFSFTSAQFKCPLKVCLHKVCTKSTRAQDCSTVKLVNVIGLSGWLWAKYVDLVQQNYLVLLLILLLLRIRLLFLFWRAGPDTCKGCVRKSMSSIKEGHQPFLKCSLYCKKYNPLDHLWKQRTMTNIIARGW